MANKREYVTSRHRHKKQIAHETLCRPNKVSCRFNLQGGGEFIIGRSKRQINAIASLQTHYQQVYLSVSNMLNTTYKDLNKKTKANQSETNTSGSLTVAKR